MKSQVITKVITDLPLVTMDICRTFYGNLSYICGLKTKNVILMLVLEPSLAASMAENNLWDPEFILIRCYYNSQSVACYSTPT